MLRVQRATPLHASTQNDKSRVEKSLPQYTGLETKKWALPTGALAAIQTPCRNDAFRHTFHAVVYMHWL